MIRFSPIPMLLLCATTASASVLPLKPGAYVLAKTACHDPAFAATFTYDGRHFSYPHASACRSATLSQTGRKYRVKETCLEAGDGSGALPSSTIATYEIQSATRLVVRKENGGEALTYRWCSAK